MGGLVGGFSYDLINSYSEGDVEYDGENADGQEVYIGGLLGEGNNITGCYATGNVQGALGTYVGGLLGNGSEVTGSHATGQVSGGDFTGGLAGQLKGKIEDSYATGAVDGRYKVGGLIGCSAGSYNFGVTVKRCMASGDVIATKDFAGGLIGLCQATSVTECYAEGNITGTSNVGGLIGSSGQNSFTCCYARGSVNGDGTGLAGLIGDQGLNYLYCCYATGAVTGPEGCTAGLRCKGYPAPDNQKSYYDRQTTGQGDDALDIPCSTEEMRRMATFTGWDFETVWGRRSDINDGYPYLRWTQKESLPNDTDLPLGIGTPTGRALQDVRKVIRDGKVIIETSHGSDYQTDGKKLR